MTPSTNDTLTETIRTSAGAAKKVQTDEMAIEEHSLADLIKADIYLEKKQARQNGARFHVGQFSGGRPE